MKTLLCMKCRITGIQSFSHCVHSYIHLLYKYTEKGQDLKEKCSLI